MGPGPSAPREWASSEGWVVGEQSTHHTGARLSTLMVSDVTCFAIDAEMWCGSIGRRSRSFL